MKKSYKETIADAINKAERITVQSQQAGGQKISITAPNTNVELEYHDDAAEDTVLRTVKLNDELVHQEKYTKQDFHNYRRTNFDNLFNMALQVRKQKI